MGRRGREDVVPLTDILQAEVILMGKVVCQQVPELVVHRRGGRLSRGNSCPRRILGTKFFGADGIWMGSF